MKFHFFIDSYSSQACNSRHGFLSRRAVGGKAARRCYDTDSSQSNNVDVFVKAQPRPVGKWQEAFDMLMQDGKTAKYYCGGGIFATSGTALRRLSHGMVRRLLDNVTTGANTEAGHYMERSWLGLLGVENMEKSPPTRLLIYAVDWNLLGATGAAALHNQTDAISDSIPQSPCQCVEGLSVPLQLRNFSTWDPCFKDGMVLKAVSAGRIECVFFGVDAMTLEHARTKGWGAVSVPVSVDVTPTAVEVLTSPLKYYPSDDSRISSSTTTTATTLPNYVAYAGDRADQVHHTLPHILQAIDARLNDASISVAGAPKFVAAADLPLLSPCERTILDNFSPSMRLWLEKKSLWHQWSLLFVRRVMAATRDFETLWLEHYRSLRRRCGSTNVMTTLKLALLELHRGGWSDLLEFGQYRMRHVGPEVAPKIWSDPGVAESTGRRVGGRRRN